MKKGENQGTRNEQGTSKWGACARIEDPGRGKKERGKHERDKKPGESHVIRETRVSVKKIFTSLCTTNF